MVFILFLFFSSILAKNFITGDSFRAISNHALDVGFNFNPYNVRYADIVFVNGDFHEKFFKKFFPKIKNKFILVTHNTDEPAPLDLKVLNYDKIIHMFSQNASIVHSKLTPIPIGIANAHWPHGNISNFHLARLNIPEEKHLFLGMNFALPPFPCSERVDAFKKFTKATFCENIFTPKHLNYLNRMKCTKFIISPRGHGLDCHRTWEALLVGAIPIVISSSLDKIYEDLPVLIVESWDDVVPEFLESKKFMRGNPNHPKLFFEYWKDLILNTQLKALKS